VNELGREVLKVNGRGWEGVREEGKEERSERKSEGKREGERAREGGGRK